MASLRQKDTQGDQNVYTSVRSLCVFSLEVRFLLHFRNESPQIYFNDARLQTPCNCSNMVQVEEGRHMAGNVIWEKKQQPGDCFAYFDVTLMRFTFLTSFNIHINLILAQVM